MNLLTVLSPGNLTTIQDLGRPAAQALGVPSGGAADPVALRIANGLAGNGPGAAGLEITLGGFEAEFLVETACGLAGGDLGFELDGGPLVPGSAFLARAGARLRSRGRLWGCRAYLAFFGGLDVPPVLGSRSTYVPAALGGFHGRPLGRGDELPGPGGVPAGWDGARRVPEELVPEYPRPGAATVLRCVPGPQAEGFTDGGTRTFFESVYVLSDRADRMGCRLEGPRVEHRAGADIVSDGVALGSVQVPGDGYPVVLLADRQTTGGYPKIATVITRDVPLLAQAVPGDAVRFRRVGLWQARELSMGAERRLRGWEARKK